jgi:hypothetical protein
MPWQARGTIAHGCGDLPRSCTDDATNISV